MKTLSKLLGLLRPFLGWVLLSIFLGVCTVMSAVGLMGTSAYLIASAALHPSIASLQVAIVGVRFFGIFRGLARYLERLLSHSVNFRLLEQLRVNFYRFVEPLAPSKLTDQHSGDLLMRGIGDIEILENFYVRAIAPPLVAVVVTIGLGVYIGQLDWGLSGVLITGLLLSGVAVPWLTKVLGFSPGKDIIQSRSDLSAVVVESVQGLPDLMAFGAEERQLNRMKEINRRLYRAQSKFAWVTALSSGLNSLVINGTLLIILVAAVPVLRSGRMDGVMLAVITLLTLSGFEAALPLGSAAQHLGASLTAGQRIFELEEAGAIQKTQITGVLKCSRERVDFKLVNVGFRYSSDRTWELRDFNLDLPEGKHTALLGSSGSGKSSVLNLIMGFWPYQAGSICLDGQDYQKYDPEDVRRLIGYIPQTPFIFSGSLRYNLLLAKPESTEDLLWEALRRSGLYEWAKTLPQQLDTWVGERGADLSGGERQRISIARVLLRDAPVLLLDEPTANLDWENQQNIVQTLQEFAKERSVIWVTHDLTGLSGLDEVLVLEEGKTVVRGTTQEIGEYLELLL